MAIPKIIHYVWLGSNDMPDQIVECIESWKAAMPDYELRRWDESSLDLIDLPFLHEAYAERKWAFASDVIRLYALYNFGGIYLDTDVYVYKSFDPLLENKVFVGREASIHIVGHDTLNYLTTCCIGAQKGHPFIERCYNYYAGRHFVTSPDRTLPSELRLDLTLNSQVMCRLAQELGYKPSVLADASQLCGDLMVYAPSFFEPLAQGPDSYCTHLALGSWREGEHPVYSYTLAYKVQWRLWAAVERVLRRFNRIIVKLR